MYLAGKKKGRTTERVGLPIHIRRTSATFQVLGENDVAGEELGGSLVLNDFSLEGCQFFCNLNLSIETIVLLKLKDPQKLEICGKVRWCQETHSSSHVISSRSFKYRVGLQFIFDSPNVEKEFFDFYRRITRKILYTTQSES